MVVLDLVDGFRELLVLQAFLQERFTERLDGLVLAPDVVLEFFNLFLQLMDKLVLLVEEALELQLDVHDGVGLLVPFLGQLLGLLQLLFPLEAVLLLFLLLQEDKRVLVQELGVLVGELLEELLLQLPHGFQLGGGVPGDVLHVLELLFLV